MNGMNSAAARIRQDYLEAVRLYLYYSESKFKYRSKPDREQAARYHRLAQTYYEAYLRERATDDSTE